LQAQEFMTMKAFVIPFVGLKLGKHCFEYHIDNTFFQDFGYDQFEDISVKVDLTLDKKSTLLELTFRHNGKVNVPCDITGEPFDLPINGNLNLVVQFGQEYNDENEELLILPHGEYQLNVAQYIYEMVILSIPAKRIKKNTENENIDIHTYYKYATEKQTEILEQKDIDPRWEALKEILKNKTIKNGTS